MTGPVRLVVSITRCAENEANVRPSNMASMLPADKAGEAGVGQEEGHMRLRGPLASIGALGLAVLGAGLIAVLTSVNWADTVRATMLRTTIRVNSVITFAPPPAGTLPALTAAQALRESEREAGARISRIPPGLTVKLGLFTLLVGPYCGAECHGLIVKDGLAYQDLDELAYGYAGRPSPCVYLGLHPPARPGRCISWDFVDAATGQMITDTQQKVGPNH